jgi:hypothetical protein
VFRWVAERWRVEVGCSGGIRVDGEREKEDEGRSSVEEWCLVVIQLCARTGLYPGGCC